LCFFEGLPACLVGLEACATAYHWAREIAALGHEVRLMPPAYVKAYVRRQKNDAADAAAICEAVTRPSMRFVPVKSVERQGVLTLHRARELLIRQRTMLINAVRGSCAEFGIVTAQGAGRVPALLEPAHEADALPEAARFVLRLLGEQRDALRARIHALDRRLLAWDRQDAASQRLATIPGVGIITATALSASVADPAAFRTGREFAAFLGLVPRQTSSGSKERLGRITKMGDGDLRKAPGGRRDGRRPPCPHRHLRYGRLAARPARAQAGPGGQRRHGEPDRQDRLGRPGTWGDLPPRVIETAAAEGRRAKDCRGARA
jgi:transposase